MTILQNIFGKPVNRHIEGVIKADDEASLRLEVEEYVLTNEVARRLESFLESYNDYKGANGVWISGFFGSGKSHLLKILALLLENRRIDDADALDLFLDKCEDNKILRAEVMKAVAIPSKSILFNIDQKADVISKQQTDALLSVFVKVFDEMCGYYGRQGYIARFERDLDSKGLYGQFRTAYEAVSGSVWERGREQALLEAGNIAEAYARATGSAEASAVEILDKYRSEYSVSIEDFAEQVRVYIEEQASDFRLNFFVDEVGQYIAENVKLMTNLQTIAESLATKCQGRAWIFVTAQEDMEMVVGEMGKRRGSDFSKIQDRFANRMKLTSADVAEVIQKRLLMKNEEGVSLLSEIYEAQENNFGTLFDFADGSKSYRNFQNRDHFVRSYPFIPYQFALFQSAIRNLSEHDAFEGKHRSVGERSMLSVFQQVAIKIAGQETGRLATFDLMFEGIRAALKSGMQKGVTDAETHLGSSSFAVSLLKALFLVKYVKDEFRPSVRNLSILVLDGFNKDIPALREKVEETLNLLDGQTYVQRNGEFWEYLTDQEKDIELEIKNTDVENQDVLAELGKIVFDSVIGSAKIRYVAFSSEGQGQDYPYSRKIDDRMCGREHELGINIISPFHQYAGEEHKQNLFAISIQSPDDLFVLMPQDDQMMRDTLMYKRTEKYIRQNSSITQQEEVKYILKDKGTQNQERYERLRQRVRNLLKEAGFLVAGKKIEVASKDARSRITEAFGSLVTLTYPNLQMLRNFTCTENDVSRCLKQSEREEMFGDDISHLLEPEQELLSFIQANSQRAVRTTLKNLVEEFGRKPYGWPPTAAVCFLAGLCGRGKVEVRSDSNLLEGEKLEHALRSSHGRANVIVKPQASFAASEIHALRRCYEDLFDEPPRAGEPKALGRETGETLQKLTDELTSLENRIAEYPFRGVLVPVLKELNGITGKDYVWYMTELVNRKDELLDMKENVIGPLKRFMSGPQKKIFDDAREFVRNQEHNFDYVEGEEPDQVMSVLKDPECFRGDCMRLLKTYVEKLEEKVVARVDEETAKAMENVSALRDRVSRMDEFAALSGEQCKEIDKEFDDFTLRIGRKKLIDGIRETARRFEESDYNNLLSRITEWTASTPGSSLETENGKGIECVTLGAVRVSFEKAWLADETDVDRYLESLRKALLAEIRRGNRIQT